MNTRQLIQKLNDTKVTLVSTEIVNGKSAEVMTLKDRLETSCEEGELVSGKELNHILVANEDTRQLLLFFLADNDMIMFKRDTVYCWSIEDIYRVGNSYQECIQELSEGYISQLSDISIDSDYYSWVTLIGEYPNAKINEDTLELVK